MPATPYFFAPDFLGTTIYLSILSEKKTKNRSLWFSFDFVPFAYKNLELCQFSTENQRARHCVQTTVSQQTQTYFYIFTIFNITGKFD